MPAGPESVAGLVATAEVLSCALTTLAGLTDVVLGVEMEPVLLMKEALSVEGVEDDVRVR